MIDELEALRTTRASVDPPSPAARGAARARWDNDLALVPAAAPLRTRGGAKSFTARVAIASVLATALVSGMWMVTRERIASVKPEHVVGITSLADAAATEPQVFLLVGSDSRAFVDNPTDAQRYGDRSTNAGSRSDTMVLVRVEPKTHRVLVVSIPRDLFVEIPGCGTQRINGAFDTQLTCGETRGGMQLLVDTITNDLGVPINHVIEVRFTQFANLVDELGGLRIQFPRPARDAYTGLSEPAGCVTLAGDQALSFVRSRHFELLDSSWHADPRADLGRMERQQLALRQLAAAAESRVGTDPRPVLRSLFANIVVDRGFTADDALGYFAALRGAHQTVTMTLPARAELQHDSGESGLVLASGAQSVLDALAGRGTVEQPPGGGPGAPGSSFEATAC